ncbi:hypothetical protein H6F88_21300 [Oculatella sp. FACHB-28]|uniref:hypothetical protein n=1 Tax=Cyanophyceae TaxID=3028117 RepID=UPI001689F92D|nr:MULTISPECIES: hypothetical protein [Cyanophyceae]MBD1870757.1 hypothetical protein [Cyanobacteria bacterium FACHB-471]MBD1998643.1 hypothetical protein [Leptolyngbya sp. FACHB-541]MBD2058500.1 hypothetical protein [Oculatella sp. FACHB-28]MBD2071764.1 hypothetical protein [Leptolyngbya sp. FACHB-671]
MRVEVSLSDASVEQIVEQMFAARQISSADQSKFMSLLLSKQVLTPAEQTQVNRVFDGLRSGRLKVVD